jgi:catechol 2,3-dioxygenase-like lactoylglutathione lyase family enzyme
MRINLTSVLVDDQDKALRFYTDILGFEKKTEIPLGHHRWLTVVSRTSRTAPNSCSNRTNIPPPNRSRPHSSATAFPSRLSPLTTSRRSSNDSPGSESASRRIPAQMGPVTTAVFDDTCGNLIQIAQRNYEFLTE